MQNVNSTLCWYAIRVTYCRELLVKKYLDAEGIENFIPMCHKEITIGARRRRILTPAIHNLIFIRTTLLQLQEMKTTTRLPIRYIMDRETKDPLIIPDKQMRDFIAIAGLDNEEPLFLDAATAELKHGDRVRITEGVLRGVEGEFVRFKGERRVMVTIRGVMAVATTFIHPSSMEKIDIIKD